MTTPNHQLPASEAFPLGSLIAAAPQGIASRVLARTGGGHVTLFAFDAGQGLSEHTSPYDALVVTIEGTLRLTIAGRQIQAAPGTVVRLPAKVPHAVEAPERAVMLLTILREEKTAAGA